MSTLLLSILSFLILANTELSITISGSALPPNHVFLLGGQSNMVGRGGIPRDGMPWNASDIPVESQPDESIFRFDANMDWVIAHEPIHAGIYKQPAGIGPSMPFAHAILKHNPSFGTIGLVPCAKDGSTISGWQKSGTGNYANMVRRAKASIQEGGKIAALLWWQGGADAQDIKMALEYKDKLKTFFIDLRADLGMPQLKIIQVVMPKGREAKAKYTSIIRAAQMSLDLTDIYNVDPEHLSLNDDGIHFTTESQIIVGNVLAEMFLKISK